MNYLDVANTCTDLRKFVDEIRADAIEEYKVKSQQKFKELQFETGRAWFDFDAGIDRCLEILDKVAEQLKEQK